MTPDLERDNTSVKQQGEAATLTSLHVSECEGHSGSLGVGMSYTRTLGALGDFVQNPGMPTRVFQEGGSCPPVENRSVDLPHREANVGLL